MNYVCIPSSTAPVRGHRFAKLSNPNRHFHPKRCIEKSIKPTKTKHKEPEEEKTATSSPLPHTSATPSKQPKGKKTYGSLFASSDHSYEEEKTPEDNNIQTFQNDEETFVRIIKGNDSGKHH